MSGELVSKSGGVNIGEKCHGQIKDVVKIGKVKSDIRNE